jgi:hypothetical protein
MTRLRRFLAPGLCGLGLGLAIACKIEPVEELGVGEPTPIELPTVVLPLAAERPDDTRGTAQWEETLQRHLTFTTSPELLGRRPGSPGAALTAGFVIAVWQAAGLSPSGPELGWTQAVGIRVVHTQGLSLTVVPPAAGQAPARSPLRFEDGLWLQRRGSASSDVLRLRVDGRADAAPALAPALEPAPAEPALPRLRLLDPTTVATGTSPWLAYHEAFDAAWRDGVDVAVLPIPGEDAATLGAAERWREPDVQSLLLGRDPPAALELQGFVAPNVHAALRQARATPGTTVELRYEATEQWFQDDNVIGRLAGGRHPEQVVLVATHWDEGGLSEPRPEGGGLQNAGSLAVLLAVAETVGRWRSIGRRPERSIVFLAEAAGSLEHRGIARFIEASGIRPSNVVAVIVLDRLGGPGAELLVVDGDRSTLGPQIAALDPAARAVEASEPSLGHTPFLALRVPAVTLMRPAPAGPDGTISAPSLATLRHDAELVVRLAWSLADHAEPPRWLGRDEPPGRPSPMP